jgi:hypothetical protein
MATLAIGSGFALIATAADDAPLSSSRVDSAASHFLMRPRIVVDPVAGRLYMMNPQGGIDAVEIASGKLVWTTKDAAKPLTAYDDRVVAQAEQSRSYKGLPIVLLDAQNGRGVGSTIVLPIPPDVFPFINNGPGSSSTSEAKLEPEGLLVWWTVTSRPITGIRVPAPQPVQKDSGAGLIDLKTYHVTTLTTEQVSAMLRGKESQGKAPRLNPNEGLYFPPQRADGFFVSIGLGPASEGTPSLLKRWRAPDGERLPDVDLGPGYAAWSVSVDGTLFLITKPAGSDATGAMKYTWAIYVIASGERVAEVQLPQAANPFFVRDSNLTYESSAYAERGLAGWNQHPEAIRTLNFKTGREIWARSLRVTGYAGPYPPRR